MKTIKELQEFLGTTPDGLWGPLSQSALDSVLAQSGVHRVKASSFADPGDIAAFRRCKERGHSDKFCFAYGDNGIGRWGDDTTVNVPMCALPPEDWKSLGDTARGAKVLVKANGLQVICELRDTMPYRANIKNGAGIDLNFAAVKALNLSVPLLISATWEYV